MKNLSIKRLGLTIAANLFALSALPACSLAFVSGPDTESDELQSCTESSTAPVADVVLAILHVAGGAALLGHSANDGFAIMDSRPAGAIALAAGVGYGLSAIYGYNKTDACREHNRNARKNWQRVEFVE